MQRSNIIRSDDLRSANRRRVLDTLRHAGPSTPSQTSELTGLSAASVSTLSSQLIDQGIVCSERCPLGTDAGARGRPQTQLSLNASAGYTVTVNLIIDQITTQLVDYAGHVCHRNVQSLDSRSMSEEALLSTVRQSVESVCTDKDRDYLHHIAVAFQGVTEHASGTLLWSPVMTPENVPLGQYLQRVFDVSVSVNNDCRLISQALYRQHADSLGQTFATVLFSHGVGLGLYIDGEPFAGSRTSALELGHLRFEHKGALCRCGKRGCIEAYAADYGIERLAVGTSINDVPAGHVSIDTMKALTERALNGDKSAMQAFTIAGAAVGEGLANLFTLFDPMQVAMVGRNDKALRLMRSGINTILKQQLRNDVTGDSLLHSFDSAEPLLEYGLREHSLSQVDHQFSDPSMTISARA